MPKKFIKRKTKIRFFYGINTLFWQKRTDVGIDFRSCFEVLKNSCLMLKMRVPDLNFKVSNKK